MAKMKLLAIKDVKFDKEVYPRVIVDWITSSRYFNALKSGAKFPPITVAQLDGIYILVDGAHRLQARKGLKETHVQCEILTGLTKKEIYLEAVKRNTEHGRQLSTQEITNVVLTLEMWNMSKEQISEIVRIPTDKIEPFVAKRTTRITETQEEISLKSPLRNLAGIEIDEEPNQKHLNGSSQLSTLNMVILLLERKWLDTTSQLVMNKLQRIVNLAKDYLPEIQEEQPKTKKLKTKKV